MNVSSLISIAIILAVVGVVLMRLPKPREDFPGQLAHRAWPEFRLYRAINWVCLGTAYAFLYWGRYNLNPALKFLGGPDMVRDFNLIFSTGTIVYAVSFLVNGPLTNRFGGRAAMLVGIFGAICANFGMAGLTALYTLGEGLVNDRAFFWGLVVLYAANMYFQSFGAVAIVKVNAHWFHVRERGVFGAVFGILIAVGLYLAYDVTGFVLNQFGDLGRFAVTYAFLVPAGALLTIFIIGGVLIHDTPERRGYPYLRTGDATSGDTQEPVGFVAVFTQMLTNPVIMTIAIIEFCSGFLRQGVMQIFPLFSKATGLGNPWVSNNWGMLLCIAGIMGGMFAGVISDYLFNSRRGPVAAVLYLGMLLGGTGMLFVLGGPWLGVAVVFMSLCVIGVHGMLSGTASMDFGGSKNAGIATGIIDGFVYLGSGAQGMLFAAVLPRGGAEAKDLSEWTAWPLALIAVALMGLVFAVAIRNATASPKK